MSEAQQHITSFWSMVAPGYEAHGGNVPAFDTPLYRAWVDEIGSIVPSPPTDALDVATGTGFVALMLATLGHRVTGVDLSADMLGLASNVAIERHLSIRFLFDDAVAPAFEPASFDVITSRHLLWTLREPDRALGAWRDLLRPGGLLVAFDGFWFDPRPGPHDDEPERSAVTTRPRPVPSCRSCTSIGPIRSSRRSNERVFATSTCDRCPISPTARTGPFPMC